MKMESAKTLQKNEGFGTRIRKVFLNNWRLYLLLLPGLIWLIVFCYIPMYGLTIAFKDFDSRLGIIGSPFVGLKYFRQFFSTSIASKTIVNTMMLGLAQLIFAFPVPVVFALLLNQLPGKYFKKNSSDDFFCSAFYFRGCSGQHAQHHACSQKRLCESVDCCIWGKAGILYIPFRIFPTTVCTFWHLAVHGIQRDCLYFRADWRESGSS